MDHLETFDPARLQSFDIPYLCEPDFVDDITNVQEFLLYPRTRGISNGQYLDMESIPTGQKESFFQNWLYFGFLSAIFSIQGLTLMREDFLRREGETSLITSKLLPQYLDHWTQAERDNGAEGRQERLEQTKYILQFAKAMVNEIWSFRLLGKLPSIISSIQAAGYSTSYRMKLNWPFEFVGFPPTFGPGEIFLDQLVKQKWCPYDVNLLREVFFIDSHYYCTTLEPPRGKLSHQSCSMWHCRAANVDENSYRTKHLVPDCSCHFVEVPKNELHHIVQSGMIPLVRYNSSDVDGSPGVLELVVHDGEVQNVAISHVWSDGLGNTSGKNSLPACQLKCLQQMVNDTYNSHVPVAFYIDTLCVPRDVTYRALAIAKMRDVYKDAGRVLVLDSDIEKATVCESYTTIAVRIVLSGWARRLWTLQEGVLNSELYFKLRDGILPLGLLESWASESRQDLSYRHESVGKTHSSFIVLSMRMKNIDAVPAILSFALACDAVSWRTTSHGADETICLAILLGKDPVPLLKADPSDRMKILLLTIGEIPIALLLLSGDRLQQPGFTWAPKSLLGSGKHHHRNAMSSWYSNILRNDMGRSNVTDHKIAKILPEGKLHFRAPGYEVETQGNDLCGPIFWIIEKIGVHVDLLTPIGGNLYRVSFLEDESGFPSPLSEVERFYIIFVDDKDEKRGLANFGAVLVRAESEPGRDFNETINCNFYCRLQIGFIGDMSTVQNIEAYRNEVFGEGQRTKLLLANPIEDRTWCLS